MLLIVLVVYMLPIFVVNCFGGVHVADLCIELFWWYTCCPSLLLIVLVVCVLPIFVVNCFGGVRVAHLCS